MKKYIKFLLITIISSFILTLNVNAETLTNLESENNNNEKQQLNVDNIDQTQELGQEPPVEPYTTISFIDEEIEIEVSEEKNITATIDTNEEIDETITYSSSDDDTVLVSENGVVTGVKEGTAIITALTSNNKEATIKVIVKEVLNKFEITNASLDLQPDAAPQFTGTTSSEKYTIEEQWTYVSEEENQEGIISISTNEKLNNTIKENGSLLEKFEEGKSYSYTAKVVVKKEYANKLVELEKNTISVNGKTYKFTEGGAVNNEDGSVEIGFANILVVKVPTKILKEEVSISPDAFEYTGDENKPIVTVKKNDIVLEEDKDYRVSYTNNTNAGNATVTVEGIGEYTNTITKSFTINRKKINYNIDQISPVTYTGQEIKPTITVKDDNKELILNKDYKLEYSNNINAGTGIIRITGIGNYQGNKQVTFKINKKVSQIPDEAKRTKSIITGSLTSDIAFSTKGLKWKNSNEVIKKGFNKYQAQYLQNNDNTNYSPVDIDITVKGLTMVKVSAAVDGGHGEVVASHSEILEGKLVTFTFKPEEGYRTKSVKLNNSQLIINNNEYSIIAQDVDINLSVKFSPIEHTISINGTEYVDIDSPDVTSVIHNGTKELMISPKKGYKILSIRVNGIERINDLDNSILKLTNIISDTNIDITTEILTYRFLDGGNQTYYSDEKKPLTFITNASYKKFEKIYIDNKLVDQINFTISEGPTIITFNQNYLSKLSYGTHTLKVTYTDGGEAKTTFVLSPKAIKNPNTVDRIMSYIIVLMICLAIVIIVVYKKNNED